MKRIRPKRPPPKPHHSQWHAPSPSRQSLPHQRLEGNVTASINSHFPTAKMTSASTHFILPTAKDVAVSSCNSLHSSHVTVSSWGWKKKPVRKESEDNKFPTSQVKAEELSDRNCIVQTISVKTISSTIDNEKHCDGRLTSSDICADTRKSSDGSDRAHWLSIPLFGATHCMVLNAPAHRRIAWQEIFKALTHPNSSEKILGISLYEQIESIAAGVAASSPFLQQLCATACAVGPQEFLSAAGNQGLSEKKFAQLADEHLVSPPSKNTVVGNERDRTSNFVDNCTSPLRLYLQQSLPSTLQAKHLEKDFSTKQTRHVARIWGIPHAALMHTSLFKTVLNILSEIFDSFNGKLTMTNAEELLFQSLPPSGSRSDLSEYVLYFLIHQCNDFLEKLKLHWARWCDNNKETLPLDNTIHNKLPLPRMAFVGAASELFEIGGVEPMRRRVFDISISNTNSAIKLN